MTNNENSRAEKISKNLSELMRKHSLSFRSVSTATGIAQPHLSRLAKGGHKSPGLEVLEKISKFFKISIAQLIGDQKIDFDKLHAPVYSSKEEPKDIPKKDETSPKLSESEPPFDEKKSPALGA